MARNLKCPVCSEVTRVPTCPSCGAELLTGVGERDQGQTSSDDDQTRSDQDQTMSDRDQTGSESDQRSSDEDQRAADDDLAAGGNSRAYRRSALARAKSTLDRDGASGLRDATSAARLTTAEDRDRAAESRDVAAERRDSRARQRDLEGDGDLGSGDPAARASHDRARAVADRRRAAADRERAAADRKAAARDRAGAIQNRDEAARDLELATTDELTGAWTRRFGLERLSSELERAHRTGATLVLAFVDVDGLKQVNDREGHLTGDALLQRVGHTLRARLRPYDVVVRYGGDEFVCAMPDFSALEARARMEEVAAAMAAVNAEHSITFGLADAEPGDELQELLARADAELMAARRSRRRDV